MADITPIASLNGELAMPEKVWMQGPPGPQGQQGEPGAAATVTVGTVTTGEPGTDAIVTNSGTENAAVLNFTIPRGATGAAGAPGPQGPKGDTGETGPAGAGVPDGGTAGQLLGKTESGTAWVDPPQSGVQPDWNQNDETQPDYVKNRPFYKEPASVTVEDVKNAVIEGFPVFAVGDTVTVSVDGVEHSLVAYDDGVATIGDSQSDFQNGGGQFGWQFYVYNDSVWFYAAEAHTISYLDFVYHAADSGYFPLFNPNNNYVSGLPTPNQIYDFGETLDAIIGQTTISQLENKKAVFDYVFYDSTKLLRLMPFSVIKQDGTVTIEYIGVDTQEMRVCALEFSFNGSADDSVLTNVNMKYPPAMYVNSSTSGSTKQFKITVDDSGTISATEVT